MIPADYVCVDVYAKVTASCAQNILIVRGPGIIGGQQYYGPLQCRLSPALVILRSSLLRLFPLDIVSRMPVAMVKLAWKDISMPWPR